MIYPRKSAKLCSRNCNLNSLRSLNITGDSLCWWCCLKRMYSKFLHRYRYPSRSAKISNIAKYPNVREIIPTSVCLLRRNFYLYARLQKFFWRQRVSISTLQNRNHSRKLCEHIRESTRTLNMTVLEIFHLYAHQNFLSVCKTAKYRKTRRIIAKTLRKS